MNNDWLDIGVLEDYLDGKLDAKTMNRVEREALEDPFVAEALAGLSESPKRSLQSISLLQKQLQERIADQQATKKATVITWQRLSIAATAAVLFVSVSIMFWMKENVRRDQLAKQPKKVEVNIAPDKPKTAPVTDNEALAATTSARVTKTEPSAADKTAVETEVNNAIQLAKTHTYAVNRQKKAESAFAKAKAEAVPQMLNEVAVVGYAAPKRTIVIDDSGIMKAIGDTVAAKSSLSGRVVGSTDGQPLQGVVVNVKGRNAVTDQNGEFKIPVDSTENAEKIRATALGFKTKELIATLHRPIVIAMQEDHTALNEVVVVAYGKKAKKEEVHDSDAQFSEVLQGKVSGLITIRGIGSINSSTDTALVSSPVNGWDAMFKYINKENKFKKDKNLGRLVELSFGIDKAGKPTDIKVLRSLEQKYDDELVRLLTKGPKWNQPKVAGRRMTFSMTF